MNIRKLKRPIVMIVGHQSRVRVGVLGGLTLIFGVLGVWLISSAATATPHNYLSNQTSWPVNAPAEDNSIQFQFQTLKPDASGENYFVNYRLQREQFRQETKAMLSELLNSTVEKSKEQAQEKWLELSAKIQQEGEIENLLKIKGLQDTVADVLPENVTVIVFAPALTPNEVSLIQDIVVRVTKARLDKITISAKQ